MKLCSIIKIMKYAKMTLEYLYKNFLRMFCVAIVPAIVIVFFLQPKGFGILFTVEDLAGVETFLDIFFLAFNKNLFTQYPYMIVVGLGLLLTCVCYTMGMLERHFKTGKLSLRNPFSMMNNAFIPALIVLSLLFAVYMIFKFLIVCVLSLHALIFNSLGMPYLAMSIIVGALGIVGFGFTLKICRPIMLSSATMLIYGYTFKDAMGVTVKMGDKQSVKEIDLALLLPFAIYMLIRVLGVAVGINEIVAEIILSVVTVFLLQYATTLIFVAFFDLTGIERRDLKKYY
ncbi:MAG: hypothetical protein J6B79_03365 [Clostridia bacterium]|nr:hypothetical protein [Clostridia bacterium]